MSDDRQAQDDAIGRLAWHSMKVIAMVGPALDRASQELPPEGRAAVRAWLQASNEVWHSLSGVAQTEVLQGRCPW